MTDRAAVELSLLGPALEASEAVAAAAVGDPEAPPVPSVLRRYLSFRTLPGKAREQVRAAVDADEEFRSFVADRVDPARCGRAGALWLQRPEGWAEQLAVLVDEAVAEADATRAADEEREARRRVPQLSGALRRAEARIVELEAERDEARRDAVEAAGRVETLLAEVDALGAEVDRLTEERRRAVRELKETEAHLQARVGEVRRLRAAGEADRETPLPPTSPDVGAVAALVRRALAGVDALDGVLGELAELVGDEEEEGVDGSSPPVSPRRRPLRIGQGLDERSPEGARWLLERRGVVVVVDGYNLTMTVWPDLELSAQREQAVRSLAALSGRTGASFEVVFDGDDVAGPALSEPGVAVRFSAAGVEADDEVVERVDTVPVGLPVVVVSDDRRVRRGARDRGANVVGSEQLRAVLLG